MTTRGLGFAVPLLTLLFAAAPLLAASSPYPAPSSAASLFKERPIGALSTPTPPRPGCHKKRGGQPGHPKHARPLVPTDDCDRGGPLARTACRRWHAVLTGTDPTPVRHQVWELPEIKPVVTEYQRHRLTCRCGATTCADLPPGVPVGQSGPRLVALTGLPMAYFRQSKRRAALFLEALLNQPCCAALTVKMQQHVTQALRPSYDELVEELPAQDQLGMDESPTKEGPNKAWLWTAVGREGNSRGVPARRYELERPLRVASGLGRDRAIEHVADLDRYGPAADGRALAHVDSPRMCTANLTRIPSER